MIRILATLIVLAGSCSMLQAHEVRPAYLELTQTDPDVFDVLWKVPAMGNGLRLGLYVRFPENCEIVSEPTAMFVGNAYVERSRIRAPAALVGSTIHIDGLKTTLTDVLVRIERADGTTQVARLMPESPSLVVEASPSAWQVAWTYLVLGCGAHPVGRRPPSICACLGPVGQRVGDGLLRRSRHSPLRTASLLPWQRWDSSTFPGRRSRPALP